MRCAQRTRFVAFNVLKVCRHPVIGCAMRPDTTIAMNAVSTEPAHPITLCNRFVDGQDSSVLSCAEVAGSTSWHLKMKTSHIHSGGTVKACKRGNPGRTYAIMSHMAFK